MIKIANGAYTYGTQTGFHDVNINVNRGDAVCIMGPNGSGKSTLLKTIVGLLVWRMANIHLMTRRSIRSS